MTLVQAIQDVSAALPKVLAPLGAIFALWRSLVRHRSQRDAERDQLFGQAVDNFAAQPSAAQFFRELQLQDTIRRTTELLVMPAEFEAVFRFMREEHASLWTLRQAWPYRHRTADGRFAFTLSGAGKFWLWSGRIYVGLCVLASGLFLFLAVLTPVEALPLAFANIGEALGVALCSLLVVYANRSETAVQQINALRRKWHPPQEPDTKSLPPPPTQPPSS